MLILFSRAISLRALSPRRFFEPDVAELITDLDAEMHDSYAALNRAIGSLIEEYSMVSFVPMDISKSDSVELVLAHVDTAIQVRGFAHR